MNLFETFDAGIVVIAGKRTDINRLPWHPHKDYKGVFFKHVFTADQADGLGCNLVRVEPGHELGAHIHPDSVELHEVLAGSGFCVTEHGETAYLPGIISVIGRNSSHMIRAGENGLCFSAKFLGKFVTIPV